MGVWKVAKSVLKTTSRALLFRKKSKQPEVCKSACDPANQKQKKKIKEEMGLMKPEFRAKDPLYCKDEVAVDAAKRIKKEAGYSGDTITRLTTPMRQEIEDWADSEFKHVIPEYRWAKDDLLKRYEI
ncbi:unnamed protein product [Prunus brigantina]